MKTTYELYRKSQNEFQSIEVDEIDSCPMCHSGGHPHFEGGYILNLSWLKPRDSWELLPTEKIFTKLTR